MNKRTPLADISPVPIIAEWEGPAVLSRGMLLAEKTAEELTKTDAADVAAWIAVTCLSAPMGSPQHQAMKAKVLSVLSAWHKDFGPAKIEEAKRRLIDEMQTYRANRRISDEEVLRRIDQLFAEIPG